MAFGPVPEGIMKPQLAAIAAGESATLDNTDAARFGELYLAHMDKEEGHIAPMAKRLFAPEQTQRRGNAMRINDPKCVAKTFPEYFEAFAGIAKNELF